MKYYAVKKGRKTGIFNSWEECKEQTHEFIGSEFKSFPTLEEAESYLNPTEKEIDDNIPKAYVDGSYNEAINEYSFGVVFLYNGNEMHFKKSFPADELSSMRNVAGEIKGAGFIIMYCLNRGIKQLVVYHDYIGISKWYQNEWKANLYGTKKYQEFANNVNDDIEVTFVKVKIVERNNKQQ